ncbi:MAG: hypothetical protein R2852_09180 [Bacteroidia bacterium]
MHTKILIRSESFHLRYQQWKEKDVKIHLEMLRGSYANEVFGKGSDDLKYERNKQYTMVNWQPTDINFEELAYLHEYFKNILLKNNYFQQLSDERTEVFDNGLKLTVHRHYLKPNISLEERYKPNASFLFGNIFLEHRFNSQSNSLSITANYYGDKQYDSFERFMELILK